MLMDNIEDKYIPEEGYECLGYMQYESGFYWIDEEHDDKIWVTPEMVKGYSLDLKNLFTKEEHLEEKLWDWGEGEDYDGEVNRLCEFSHYIYMQFCTHVTMSKEDRDNPEKWTEETIHGNIYSEEFLAWLNDCPLELLRKSDLTAQ